MDLLCLTTPGIGASIGLMKKLPILLLSLLTPAIFAQDMEAGGLLLDVFRDGEKKTISFSEEELLDGSRDGRNGLREKVEGVLRATDLHR